jgi:RNA polymerase sigma factor (sigma-70 family)
MNSDTEMLRQYVEERSEGAFADLVREHLNLVYSAALREMNGDTALAEDLSQAVFTDLAHKAGQLLSHPSLAGWLYLSVRRKAANLRRSEHRRRHREEEAHTMNELLSDDSPERLWQQVRPLLDDALHELNETDRAAVVLRFLEERSLRDVGQVLGVQENAARMRVERALEKLRGLLARRGVTSSAGGLAAALAVGVITPAPQALAASIACGAVSGAAGASATLTLMKFMSATKIGLISALAVAAVAVPAWQQTRLWQARAESAQLQARLAASQQEQAQLSSLRAGVQHLQSAEVDQAELQRLRDWQAQTQPELLRLRGMAGVARRANAEAEALRAQLARQALQPGTNLVTTAMAEAMKLGIQRQAEDQLQRLALSLKLSPEQMQAAREILLRKVQAEAAGMQQAFSGKFDRAEIEKLAKEAGNTDEQIKALLTPEQLALYPAYQNEEATNTARQAANAELMQLSNLNPDQQDRAFAALYQFDLDQLTGKLTPPASGKADAMQWALEQKAKVLEPILTSNQMESYRQQQAIQANLVRDISNKMQNSPGSP